MWEVLKDEKLSAGEKYFTLLEFDQVLGLGLKDLKVDKIPKEVVKLAEERLSARLDKDWKKADDLREKIAKFGYIVGDSKDGYELKKEQFLKINIKNKKRKKEINLLSQVKF